tara:strand:- start:19419 stop:22592 length:3174 start_codon:yes stop_codon:yes gene_type:complete
MLLMRSLILGCVAFFSTLSVQAQAVAYNGQQDLRPTFMGKVYEIEGGQYDGKRGYLFRIWNREGVPVQLSTIPDQFNQPVEDFLGVSAQYSNGYFAFSGDTQPYRTLFSTGTETLNPSPSGNFEDRPANFIAIVDASVDTIVFSLRGRTATGSYAAAEVEPLLLEAASSSNVSVTFKTDGLTYTEFLDAVSQNSTPAFDITSDVFVDGVNVGSIPEGGPLSLSLEPGDHVISGAIERLVGGSQAVSIVEGQVYNLTIELSGEALAGILTYDLAVNDDPAPVIATTASEFRIDFESPEGIKYSLRDNFLVQAARVQADLLFDGPPERVSATMDLTSYFQRDLNGGLYATNPGGVIAALLSMGAGPYELVVAASDATQNLPLEDSIMVRLSKYALNGDVVRLSSSPSFPLGSISVTAASMKGGVSKTVTTASDGSFTFGMLPEDTYKVSSETIFSSETLAVEGFVSLTESTQLALTPLSIVQTVAGEQGFVVVSGASATNLTTQGTQNRESSPEKKRTRAIKTEWDRRGPPSGRPNQTIKPNSKLKPVEAPNQKSNLANGNAAQQLAGPTFSINLESESGTTQTQTIQVEIPGSQTTLSLGYYIQLQPGSAIYRDYPDYWNIQLRDQSGVVLFSSGNSFSSSIRSPSLPFFSYDFGSYYTDYITESVSLPPSQTPANDRTLSLTVTAATSWDSEIFANISAEFLDFPLLGIVSSGPAVSNAPATLRYAGIPGSVVSIPNTGGRNYYNIRLPVTIQRVDTGASIALADIDSVEVEILFGDGGSGGSSSLFSESAPVQQLQLRPNSADIFEIDVSFIQPTPSSAVATTPPAESPIAYRVIVEALDNGDTIYGEGVVRGLTGLYQTAQPLSLARTGAREDGQDDWAQKGLYDWLSNNANLIGAMNDISGEHGRDIKHASHRKGLDLDMNFFNSTQAGSVEHIVLTNNVIAAIRGDQASRVAVVNYVVGQQTGIETLAAQNVLSNIFGPEGTGRHLPSANGHPAFSLPEGWAGALFEDGVVRDINGNVLLNINRTMNSATSALFIPDGDHNDHLHLSFMASAL